MIRKRLRLSLRSLLALTAICAVFLALNVNRYRKHKAAVSAIHDHGGTFAVKYDGPEWLRKRFDDTEYFYNCTRVNLGPHNQGYNPTKPIGDAELRALIPHMNAFSNFHILDLWDSNVSDDGLRSIQNLHFIDELVLRGTPVSDEGLQHVADVPTIKQLDLRGTSVTPSAVHTLLLDLPNCSVQTDFPLP